MKDVGFFITFRLNFHDSEDVKNGRQENQYDEHRGNILDDDDEEFLCLERCGNFQFVDDGLRLENITDENAGKERNDRHEDAVAYEVEHIEDAQTEDADVSEDTEAERRGNAEKERTRENEQTGLLASETEFVFENGDDRFHQGDGRRV